MGLQKTRVIAVVSEYWLSGDIPLKGDRIQDVLNDHGTEFLRLSDVRVGRFAETEPLATLSEAVVPKSSAQFVVVPQSQHEAPEQRVGCFSTKATKRAFVIIRGYSIQGELHLPTSDCECLHTLTNQLGRFFPITSVCIRGADEKSMSAPLLFANRPSVDCFCIGEIAQVESAEEGRLPLPDASDVPDEQLRRMLESVKSLIPADDAATTACGADD